MHRLSSRTLIIVMLLSGVIFAQSQSEESLGNVARINRAQQKAQQAAGTMPKVITNQDLPAGPAESPESSASEPMTMVSGVKKPDSYADRQLSHRLLAEQRAGQQWKQRIQEQESRIADLQARIDRVNASIHTSVGTAQYDTPVNRDQAIQSERLAMLQQMLDQQKRRLSMMEDAARHAGMGQ